MEDSALVGIVNIHLNSLDFTHCREIDHEAVSHLVEVFNSGGCNPGHDLNIIKAVISTDELHRLLQASALTRNQLQLSISQNEYRPHVNTENIQIRCLEGGHRVEAGKRVLSSNDFWWTVKLYCFIENHQYSDFTLREGERFSHETKFSDGAIYCKVRHYMERQLYDLVDRWKLRLSKCKRQHLDWLLEKDGYTTLLDAVFEFVGLRIGFELGNLRRHFALRCDEEIHNYLRHIFTVWNTILLDDPALRRFLDIETVRRLQARVPHVNVADRRFVMRGMESGLLFPQVTDPNTRRRIQIAILQLTVIIPTMKTLHENCKLLEIGVKIIRSQIGPDRNGSLFNSLREMWRPPPDCLIEVDEGVFQRVVLSDNAEHVRFAYLQVFLAAFRQFPNLSEIPPRRDLRHQKNFAAVQVDYQRLFATRAKILGFSNRKILEMSFDNSIDLPLIVNSVCPDSVKRHIELKRRYGRPFGMAHTKIQKELFFPTLIDINSVSEVSAMFVQQDFTKAFFRPLDVFEIDNQAQLTYLVRHRSAQIVPVVTPNRYTAQTAQEIEIPVLESPAMRQTATLIAQEGIIEEIQQEILSHPMAGSVEVAEMSQANFGVIRERSVSPDTLSTVSSFGYIVSPAESYRLCPNSGGLTALMSGAIIDGDFVDVRSARASIVEDIDSIWDSDSRTVVDSEVAVTERSERASGETLVESEAAWESGSSPASDDETEIGTDEILLQGRRSYANTGQNSRSIQIRSKARTKRKLRFTFSKLSKPTSATRKPNTNNLGPAETRHKTISYSPQKPTDRRDHRSYAQAPSSQLLLRSSRKPLSGDVSENDGQERGSEGQEVFEKGLLNEMPKALTLQGSRSYLHEKGMPQIVTAPLPSVTFFEYNGMTTNQKKTVDMAAYLKKRKGWIGMVIENSIPRSLRLDHIPRYIKKEALGDSRMLVLVKQPHAEHFRSTYIMKRRTLEEDSLEEIRTKRTRLWI